VTDNLIASFGLYGGTLLIGFIAGLFPIISIEALLLLVVTIYVPTWPQFAIIIVLAAVGHQLAKTSCYFAGAGMLALPRGKLKQRIDAAREHIDHWNKRPQWVLWISATVGLPPMYIIGFIARPLLHIRFVRFTVICFIGRVGRYAVMTIVPLWLKS
jgi:membrane protein YqaA with SNARE-associated domain